MHDLPLYLGCVACVARRGERLGSRKEEAEGGAMMSECACAVESRGPNRRRLVICWRKGGEFDTFASARALKGELSAVHGEGWGNFWLPCSFRG